MFNYLCSKKKKPEVSAEGKLEPTIEVLVGDSNLKVAEGNSARLQWKLKGRNT